MKLILQFLISGLVGFVVVYALMTFSDIDFSGEITVISLLTITIILIVISAFRVKQIKGLNKQKFSGDEEDEIEDRKYKLFADYSLYVNTGFFLSVLTLSLSVILTRVIILAIASLVLLIITYLLIQYMTYLMQQVNPERNLPNSSDPNYAQKVLDSADDGEKHVILNGLYKSYNLLNIALIIAIFLSTAYSLTRDQSQTFSIILMAAVLLVINCRYLLAVRNK